MSGAVGMNFLGAVTAFLLFALTAAAEIGGCFAFYAWLRLGRSAWWIPVGAMLLAMFAWLLTLHPTAGAGRIYAAYGGVYIAASVLWFWLVEQREPDRWDVLGASICLVGAAMILRQLPSKSPTVAFSCATPILIRASAVSVQRKR